MGKSEGIPMVDTTFGAAGAIQPAEVKDVELYHSKSWVTKYVFCQDAKVIAIQYSITALSIGLVALVLSWLIRLQLAFPSSFSAISPGDYLQFITVHGMIMVIYLLTALFLGGFGNYLIPLMVGARDMVFPYVNMVSYWVYLLAVLVLVASFFMPGGPTGSGWTLYPPQAIPLRHSGAGLGHHSDARVPDPVHHRLHHGRIELCGDGLAVAHAGDDADAHAPDGMGHRHGHGPRVAGLPRLVRWLRDAAVRQDPGDQLFHSSRCRAGTTLELQRRQSAIVSAPLLVLRPSRGLHRRPAGLRHCLRPDRHPCEKKHLRLSHDGVGDRRHRCAQLHRMGAPHVCERHEPVFWVLLRHHHAHHRRPNGHQGLQLGAHFVARRHSPDGPDAVRPLLHRYVCERGTDRAVPRQRRRGRSAVRHHVRRRPLSHGDGHGAHFRDFRCDLPLVPEGHRADDERDARQVSLLGHVPRGLFDLLPHALSGPAGCAAPVFRDGRHGFCSAIGHDAEWLHHRGGIDRGPRPDGVPVQPDLEPVQGQAGWQQSLAGHHAGVANTRNPAGAWQLGKG